MKRLLSRLRARLFATEKPRLHAEPVEHIRILEGIRPRLMADPSGRVREGTVLRVDTCRAVRRARDGTLLGYRVWVQLDPALGVP